MRSLYIILLLIVACISSGYALDSKSSSSLIQKRTNGGKTIEEDCDESTTMTATGSDHKPTPIIINPPCCDEKSQNQKHKPQFEPQVIGASVLLLAAGLYLTAYGFPLFRVTIAVVGFIFGAAVAWIGLQAKEPTKSYPNSSDLYIGICVAVGVVMALVCIVLYKVGMYLVCMMAGTLLAIYFCCWKENLFLPNIFYRTMFVVGIIFLFVLGLIFLEYATVIISLAMIGVHMIAIGVDLFVRSGFLKGFEVLLDFNQERNLASKLQLNTVFGKRSAPGVYRIDWKTNTMMGTMIAVFFLSVVFQTWFNRGNRFGLRVVRNSNDTLYKMK